jgi:hypothetical protein
MEFFCNFRLTSAVNMRDNLGTFFDIHPPQAHLRANCNGKKYTPSCNKRHMFTYDTGLTERSLYCSEGNWSEFFRVRVTGMCSFTCIGSRILPQYDFLRIIKYEEVCYSDSFCIFTVLQSINGSPAERMNNSLFKTAKYSLVSSFPAESENVFVTKFNVNDLVQCSNPFSPYLLPAIKHKVLMLTNRRWRY